MTGGSSSNQRTTFLKFEDNDMKERPILFSAPMVRAIFTFWVMKTETL